jgi:hypothetical protein
MAVYGVLAIDGRDESAFETGKTNHSGEGTAQLQYDFY